MDHTDYMPYPEFHPAINEINWGGGQGGGEGGGA